MTKRVYLHYLEQRMVDIQNHIKEAKQALQYDSPLDKVHAAGELVVLERRLQDVTKKIDRLRVVHEGLYSGLKTELQEDVDSIGIALDRLFSGVR
jgi:hypothetical protein